MKILGIGWLGLVSDRPETRHFYSQVLGLNLLEETPAYVYFEVDSRVRLEILSRASHTAEQLEARAPAIGFLVADLEGAIEELQTAGTLVRRGIEEWRSVGEMHRWIYFEDPDGHTLLLVERNVTS